MAITPANPANTPVPSASAQRRVPMSVPRQKLSAQEIPGYYLHWIRGTPDRIEQALKAGYEFVDKKEQQINNMSPGGDAASSGNTDLGSRVSVVAGEELGVDGQPIRLYLMKLKEEWHQEDLVLQTEQANKLINAIKQGQIGVEKDAPQDRNTRYIGSQSRSDMFTPKPLRRA